MESRFATIRRVVLPCLAAALVLLAVGDARANTVYSNLGAGGTFSGGGILVCGASTDCGEIYWDATTFIPTANYTLSEIDIALTNEAGTNGATVQLVNSVGGLPGTTVYETWTLSGLPAYGATSLGSADMLMSSGPAVQLTSGTQYWVVAEPADSTTKDVWNYNSTGAVGNYAFSDNGGTKWNFDSTGPQLAFVVASEPSVVVLFLTSVGLCALAGILRRRKSRARTPALQHCRR